MSEIRVAIAGVGNCASALVQGVYYYGRGGLPGLMKDDVGGYKVTDIRFVAAFDVNKEKIGTDLSKAIFTEPNCCARFADVPELGVEVLPAPIIDGVAPHTREAFKAYGDGDGVTPVDVADVLSDVGADMLLNFIPVGSYMATRYYAEACLKAGCAFVNCIPEFIASDPSWARRFEDVGLPVAGDDIKSQVGATMVHRSLIDMLISRGAKVMETYQLNVGGNTDFLNMTVEERLKTKRVSKTEAVTSLIPYETPTRIGPSDYVPFLGDTKICYIFIRAKKFGGTELTIDLKLRVEDSPNAAGVAVDVIRAVKLALDRGVAGPLTSVSAWAFKHPPVQVPDPVAKQWFEEFVEGKRER